MAIYMKQRRETRRQQLLELAGNQCSECGSTCNLQFDHRNPETKLFVLSGAGLDKSWTKVLLEFEKCDLLCDNCHLQKTLCNKEFKGGHNKNTDHFKHGTARTYSEQGCRCDLCKKAKKLYRDKHVDYTTAIGESPSGKATGF